MLRLVYLAAERRRLRLSSIAPASRLVQYQLTGIAKRIRLMELLVNQNPRAVPCNVETLQ
jgi:hypothetical protein